MFVVMLAALIVVPGVTLVALTMHLVRRTVLLRISHQRFGFVLLLISVG